MFTSITTLLEQNSLTSNVAPTSEQWHTFIQQMQAKEARQKLLHQSMLNGINAGIVILTPDLYIVDVNRKALRMMGYSNTDDLSGKHLQDVLSPTAYAGARPRLLQVLQDDQFTSFEHKLKIPTGSPVYLKVNLLLLHDADGQPLYIQSVMQDITAQKEAEAALQEKHHQLQTVLNTAPIILWSCNTEGITTLSEGHGLARIGRQPGQAVGQSIYDIYRETPAITQAVEQALAGERANIQVTIHGRHFDSRYRPIRQDGKVTGVVGVAFDITELEKTRHALVEAHATGEKNLRFLEAILNNSSDGITVLDIHGWVQQTNNAFNEMFDIKPDAHFGKTFKSLFFVESHSAIETSIKHLQTIRSPMRFEARIPRNKAKLKTARLDTSLIGQNILYVDIQLSPIITYHEGLTGIVCSVRDVTAYKALEANLEKARDEALDAVRVKSEFLATMSHELRTPLNSILGVNTLLQATELDDDQRELSEIATEQSEVLLHHINEILDFSKLEANKMVLDIHKFNIHKLINLVVHAQQHKADKLKLLTQVDPKIPDTLYGDSHRLRQVLTNLISNAIKFTEEGSVLVKVTCTQANQSNVSVHFAVRDTGIGIAPDVQKKLFLPFTQADSSHSRRYGGTGLGLAIVRGILELMGSEITLKSTKGQGAIFSFTISFQRCEGTNTK